jgi:hypothetical protein
MLVRWINLPAWPHPAYAIVLIFILATIITPT